MAQCALLCSYVCKQCTLRERRGEDLVKCPYATCPRLQECLQINQIAGF